jgi:predicted nucleic acid-binding protein
VNSTTPVVVDTDVVSFLFRAHSLAPADEAIPAGRSLAVSPITLAEIEYGMEERIRAPYAPLSRTLYSAATGYQTARAWARIRCGCEKKGKPISFADAWIARSRTIEYSPHHSQRERLGCRREPGPSDGREGRLPQGQY